MDAVVDDFANIDFCDAIDGDEHCTEIVEAVLRNGLPLLAVAADNLEQVSRNRYSYSP